MTANILITGASSGLGAALARAYAVPETHLSLWGRDADRLAQVIDDCRARGATATGVGWDFRDIEGLAARLEELDRQQPIDLAIFSAGLGGTTPSDRIVEAPERSGEIAMVNFTAPLVGATAVANRMVQRRRGHIVVIGSLLESLPLPIAPTYAAAKTGLKIFAEALGIGVRAHGVAVTLVSPGFVDTPMSRQVSGPKPLMITAEAAAAIIRRGIARRSPRIVFPRPLAMLCAIFLHLPRRLRHGVLRRVKA
jgi:short-subunit dehydrogenase